MDAATLPGGAKTSVLPANPTPVAVSASRRFKTPRLDRGAALSRVIKLRSGDGSSCSPACADGYSTGISILQFTPSAANTRSTAPPSS
jgi:hypothetical protein